MRVFNIMIPPHIETTLCSMQTQLVPGLNKVRAEPYNAKTPKVCFKDDFQLQAKQMFA